MTRNPTYPLTCIALFIAAALLPLAGCEKKSDASQVHKTESSVPVTLAKARTEPVQRYVEVVGTLWGDEDATISNKVPGKVIAIYADIGDRVSSGEPLAQLLKADYELDRNQKQSALQESLAKLGLRELPTGELDVNAIPAVRRAKLQTDNAESRYNRGKQLHDQDPPLLSDQDFADLRLAWEVAKSGYDAEVLSARGLLGEARTRAADLAIAEQALADTTIRAPRARYDTNPATLQPIPGPYSAENAGGPTTRSIHDTKAERSYVIASRMCSVGELKTAVTPMFRLVDDNPVKLRAAVPERFISRLKVGQTADVTIEAYPDTFHGQVTRINPQIDPANRTFQIEVLIPNDDHRLFPGAFARAQVHTQIDPGIVFVPVESVITFAGVNKVFTVKAGKAVEHNVELGQRRAGQVEIVRGLNGGEEVVVKGAGRLATGVGVRTDTSKTQPSTSP